MSSPDHFETLNEKLHELIGKELWSVFTMPAPSAMVLLDIGGVVPRSRPPKNNRLSGIQKTHRGEYRLFIVCASWRVEDSRSGSILDSCLMKDPTDDVNARGLMQLLHCRVSDATVGAHPYDLTLCFDDRFVFRVFCDAFINEGVDYHFAHPSGRISCGRHGILEIG